MSQNVWATIPLEDYEKHMAHGTVGQMQLLNHLTKKYYQLLLPKTVLLVGVSGGNGLEHIDNKLTRKVIGVDINRQYLDETSNRYARKITGLELVNADVRTYRQKLMPADFIWAALILEYTGMTSFFEFTKNNLAKAADLIISIQSNNGVQSVSASGVDSIKTLGSVFHLIEPQELLKVSADFGFILRNSEENFLPNGKSIKTFHFKYS